MDPSKVRPDAITDGQHFWIGNRGRIHSVDFSHLVAVEVKAYAGNLSVNSNQYQILGHIDFLANNITSIKNNLSQYEKSNVANVHPVLFMITTGDTELNTDIALYANQRGVYVWQSIAHYDPATQNLYFSQPKWIEPLNSGYTAGTPVPPSIYVLVQNNYNQPEPL